MSSIENIFKDKYTVINDDLIDINTLEVIYKLEPLSMVYSYNFFCINDVPYFIVNYNINRDCFFKRVSINLNTMKTFVNSEATVVFLEPIKQVDKNIVFKCEWYLDGLQNNLMVKVSEEDAKFEVMMIKMDY